MIDLKVKIPVTREEFAAEIEASNDLLTRFTEYKIVLEKWQERVNLVSSSTLPDIWGRHFLDSAQLYPLLPKSAQTLVDLGSGAGFPGLVLALMISESGGPDVHLVEADSRKAAFLKEAARVLGVNVTVHSRRLESMQDFKADIVTARALSPLTRLLEQSERFIKPTTTCLFMKGEKVSEELTIARKHWTMTVTETASVTHNLAKILNITKVSGVD